MLTTVTDVPVPVIADIQGPAVGAGCQLALACDLRVMGEGAVTWVPAVQHGFALDPWTVNRAVELLGGVHLPTPNADWITPHGDWIRSRHPLPDGSLLIRLEGKSRTLRMAAESLTGEQRDEVLALVKSDLVGEAVTELARDLKSTRLNSSHLA